MTTFEKITIATRESRLALWQAQHIKALLGTLYPEIQVNLLGMTTQGDQMLDHSLAHLGGKGLFIKELEQALLTGQAHLAVHSLKDLPYEVDTRFQLAAMLPREDASDAWVSKRFSSPEAAHAGSRVGTSSLRRQSQLKANYPKLEVLDLRGNLDTRLRKLDDGEFDAIVLASAGLKRLGLAERITSQLPMNAHLPAVAQGTLVIEILQNQQELAQLLRPLNDEATQLVANAERAVSATLKASCASPLAVHAQWLGTKEMQLTISIAALDGSKQYQVSQAQVLQTQAQAEQFAVKLSRELFNQAGATFMHSLGFSIEARRCKLD